MGDKANATGNVDPQIDDILSDPTKRAVMWQRLAMLDAPHLTHSGSNGSEGGLPPSSGFTSTAGGSLPFSAPPGVPFNPAAWYPFLPFPVMTPQPFAWPPPALPQVLSTSTAVAPGVDSTLAARNQTAGDNPTSHNMEDDNTEKLGDGYESDHSGGVGHDRPA